jgi:hypothetical protein
MSIDGFSSTVRPPEEPVPGCRVVSFIDQAGTGLDLAFTQGLAAAGRPELLLWARPTEGSDPGADWALTHRERSELLGQWALDMFSGRLGSGDEREELFDGGTTAARFRFGRPGLVTDLHHPQLPEAAWMISVSWSLLRRARAGAPAPLGPAAARRMQSWISRAEATGLGRCSPDSPGPISLAGLGLGTDPHRFGPMTPWVEARIAQLPAAGPELISTWLGRQHLAGYARPPGGPMDDLERLAARTRRTPFCREASRVAQEVSAAIVGRTGRPTRLWDQILDGVLLPLDPAEHDALESALGAALNDGLEELLLTAVLADRATPSLIADGSGPWEWAVSGRQPPGRAWLAAADCRQVTRELLAPATAEQLAEVAARAEQPFRLEERFVLGQLVGGLQTTTAASARPGRLIRRDQRRGLPPPTVQTVERVAGQLLAAIAQPHRFAGEHWELIRQTIEPVAPGLDEKRPPATRPSSLW